MAKNYPHFLFFDTLHSVIYFPVVFLVLLSLRNILHEAENALDFIVLLCF